MLRVDAPAAAMHELERNLRLSDDVIRYLTVRVEALEEGPSIVMQARTSRDERGDRGGRFDRDRGDRRGGRDFGPARAGGQTGRASWRERVLHDVVILVVAGSLKKKTKTNI